MSSSENKKKERNNSQALVATIIFSCLIGTYLDLLFVSKQMYAFPVRPFPQIFTINIAFTLLILPVFTVFFLRIVKTLPTFSKIIFIILIGLCMSISEQFAEQLGWFTHSEGWHHSYSFFGYTIFMLLIWKFYRWFK
ncbi:hypothetical protein COE51_17880 [Bacillus pseudomycoides]|nr:hypothetical protein COE51_17880 [Bacillus pseudomycoides]